jgi:hypothetical protein
MRSWTVRTVLAAGLVVNAAVVRHPVALAIAQAAMAVVVLAGWGGPAGLAIAALLIVPVPIAEARRWLSHVPMSCKCNRTSGRPGPWAAIGAAADAGLIAAAVWLAKLGSARPTGAATES